MRQKVKEFCIKQVKHIFSFIIGIIGFFVQITMQQSNNNIFITILNELNIEGASKDSISRIIDKLNNPWSVTSLIWFILFFACGEILSHLLFSNEQKTILINPLSSSNIPDDFIINMLCHIRENVYAHCSGIKEQCIGCGNLVDSDGLIRCYLYNETEHLETSIKNASIGKYILDTEIVKFHTLAIQYLLQANGTSYSVMQWIGGTPFSDRHKYQETYDKLDFDFLQKLISEIMGVFCKSSYEKEEVKTQYKKSNKTRFYVRWLLVGDWKCMKNNYDYIFYVMKKLENSFPDKGEGDYYSKLEWIFHFYYIEEEVYNSRIPSLLLSERSSIIKEMFTVNAGTLQPSFGLFGNMFMFADGNTRDFHGTIYTNKFLDNGTNIVEKANKLYDETLPIAHELSFRDLKDYYDKIIIEDPAWETMLEQAWGRNKFMEV